MMHPLQEPEYTRVRPLFPGQHLALVIEGLIAGNSPGILWVDDVAKPQTALLWDELHCCYLGGAADDPASLRDLGRLVAERILPEAQARQLGILKVAYSSGEWEKHIAAIFPRVSFKRLERVFYALGRLALPDWRERIPAGFTMRPIDRVLLAEAGLVNHRGLVEEIRECWGALENFAQRGFGYCLLHGEEIVCRCTAEYVSAGRCGIGIETAEAYRGRGLAKLTASAFVEHCVARRIAPHWDVWKDNRPSVAVAERVGFIQAEDYAVYFGRQNATAQA